MKAVHIQWRDCAGDSGWCSREDSLKVRLSNCDTIGFLIEEDEESMLVTSTWDSTNDNYDSPLRIPKFAVEKVTDLEVE